MHRVHGRYRIGKLLPNQVNQGTIDSPWSPLLTDAIRVARFMGVVGGETMHWPNMILLHHHNCILIVDKDNVIVNINYNSF